MRSLRGAARDKGTNLDAILSAAIALTVLLVYLRTLVPGLGGGGDSPKFQYLGSVLGTAHPPGYPLYIFVSFLFSKLPIGTLAYRMNLLSAVCATAAVVLTYRVLVRLQCPRLPAVAAALGLAFDRYLWARSVSAEVYALGAALVALEVLLALRWAASGRNRDLYVTVFVSVLSLGNHLTAAALGPALLVFVLITRPESVRVRTILVSVAVGLAGLAQYGFILVRSWQQSPYVEARATNLRELVGVVRGAKYSDTIFSFTAHDLLFERVPQFWRACVIEFGWWGLICLAVGLAAILVRRLRAGALMVIGAAGVFFLTLNVDADIEGFLAPGLVLLWMIAGLGMQALWTGAGRLGRIGTAVAGIALLAVPVLQIAHNYRANDHHNRTFEARYFDALFRVLPDRAALVPDSYGTGQCILYKLAGEHAARGRTIEIVNGDMATMQRYARAGYAVYVFGARAAAFEGLGITFAPVQLWEPDPGARGGLSAIEMSGLPLFEVKRSTPCSAVGNLGWRDVTEATGDDRIVLRVDDYRPFDAVVVMYVGLRDPRADPRLIASQGPERPTLAVATFRPGQVADAARLSLALRRDGVPDAATLQSEPIVRRLELRVNDRGQFAQAALALQERPGIVLVRATVDRNNPQRAMVCGWPGPDFFLDRMSERIPFGPDGASLFGLGWLEPDPDAGTFLRGVADPHAEVIVPLARAGRVRVRVRARAIDGPGRRLAITVNGAALDARPLGPGWADYTWDVPEAQWITGFNRLTVDVTPSAVTAGGAGAPRPRLADVRELMFELLVSK